jgi:hypothetical protein
MAQKWSNNATSTLASNITSIATSLTVQVGVGALYPNPGGGEFFYCTLTDGTNLEIVKVTARTGDNFTTIARAQQGTSANAFLAASPTKVDLRLTAADLVGLQTSATAPITETAGVIAIPVATGGQSGYLASADWTTFNNKAPTASPTFTGLETVPQIKSVPITPTITAGSGNIDWSTGMIQILALVQNTTMTFSNAQAGETLLIKSTASGAWTLALPAGKWVGGSQPVQTSTGTDFISAFYDGTNYFYSITQAYA